MASLNQYASRVAHIVGQPDNLSLKERIKDMIKDYFAKYIIQSIDKNGMNDNYKLSLIVSLNPVESSKVGTGNDAYYTEYITSTKIPKPMNIKNDAPFISVCIPNSSKIFAYMTKLTQRISVSHTPTRSFRSYSYSDNKILVKFISNINNDTFKNFIDVGTPKIEVTGIWESPEEVIGFYNIDDNQDLDIPFPNEMMSLVLADLLKVEFNIIPKDIAVDNK